MSLLYHSANESNRRPSLRGLPTQEEEVRGLEGGFRCYRVVFVNALFVLSVRLVWCWVLRCGLACFGGSESDPNAPPTACITRDTAALMRFHFLSNALDVRARLYSYLSKSNCQSRWCMWCRTRLLACVTGHFLFRYCCSRVFILGPCF